MRHDPLVAAGNTPASARGTTVVSFAKSFGHGTFRSETTTTTTTKRPTTATTRTFSRGIVSVLALVVIEVIPQRLVAQLLVITLLDQLENLQKRGRVAIARHHWSPQQLADAPPHRSHERRYYACGQAQTNHTARPSRIKQAAHGNTIFSWHRMIHITAWRNSRQLVAQQQAAAQERRQQQQQQQQAFFRTHA